MIYNLSYTVIIIGTILLAGCSSVISQDEQRLDFVVTPEPDGQPDFLTINISSDEQIGYPAQSGISALDNTGYPAPVSEYSKNGRSQTAIQSYNLVHPVALEQFHADAYLATISPSHIMLTNLGNPPVLPGWFFKFRKPNSKREFIIHVVDNVITGTTLTESAMDIGYTEQPIDMSQIVLDSPDIFEQFQQVGSERDIWSEALAYDLELVYLDGMSNPVWSIIDPITQEWLFSVDAVTGEEVDNPY